MDIDAIRHWCLQFPHTSEKVQWGATLCFKLDGKLFVVSSLEPAPTRLAFKCSPEAFQEMCERPGVQPAPYMARAQWIALEQLNTLPDWELRELIAESYRLVWERLPRKRQQELSGASEANPVRKKASNAASTARPTRAKSVNKKQTPVAKAGQPAATKTAKSSAATSTLQRKVATSSSKQTSAARKPASRKTKRVGAR